MERVGREPALSRATGTYGRLIYEGVAGAGRKGNTAHIPNASVLT
jgi:hypothetical protein